MNSESDLFIHYQIWSSAFTCTPITKTTTPRVSFSSGLWRSTMFARFARLLDRLFLKQAFFSNTLKACLFFFIFSHPAARVCHHTHTDFRWAHTRFKQEWVSVKDSRVETSVELFFPITDYRWLKTHIQPAKRKKERKELHIERVRPYRQIQVRH